MKVINPRSVDAMARAKAAIHTIIMRGGSPSLRSIQAEAGCRQAVAQRALAAWRASTGQAEPDPDDHPPAMASARNMVGLVADMANLLHRIDSIGDESQLADLVRRICYNRGISKPNRKRRTVGSRATRRSSERPTHRDSRSSRRPSERPEAGEGKPRVGRATLERLKTDALEHVGAAT